MDLEGIILSDISQTEKDKYCMISFIWNLKNKTNYEYNKKEIDSYIKSKLVVTIGERKGGRGNIEVGN